MKKIIYLSLFLLSTTLVAQEKWGDVDKNKVTMKEIAPVWPGCESDSASKTDACFDQKLSEHIQKN